MFALLPIGFFQQLQRKYPHVKSMLVFTHVSEYDTAGYACTYVAGCVAVLFHFHGGEHCLRLDHVVCEPFVRLFDTDVCLHLAAVEL